jgi:hypothetical protein
LVLIENAASDVQQNAGTQARVETLLLSDHVESQFYGNVFDNANKLRLTQRLPDRLDKNSVVCTPIMAIDCHELHYPSVYSAKNRGAQVKRTSAIA